VAHYKTRDYNIVAIIKGVTKASVFRDNRKHTNKYAARGKQMPAAVLAHRPHSDFSCDIEWDIDLLRVFVNFKWAETNGEQFNMGEPSIVQIHMLDDLLQEAGVVNMSMFNDEDIQKLNELVMDEWFKLNG